MNSYMKRALLASFFLVFIFSSAYAENEVTEGYDENTELTIKGTVIEVLKEMRGPVIVVLQAGSRNYKVITGPPWYIFREGIELKAGAACEVTGSKYIARDGNLYLVASRIKDLTTGKTILLRDSSGMPFWRGRGMMRRGANQGQ